MKCVAVLPVRIESSRLPGKPLLKETGKYLFQHTAEGALQAKFVDQVVVATDSDQVRKAAEEIGLQVIMTAGSHRCGTERIGEAIKSIPDAQLLLNIQSDYPELRGQDVDLLVKTLRSPNCASATLAVPWRMPDDPNQPNLVKVVCDQGGKALYFSRSPIPHAFAGAKVNYLRHLGIYGFQRATLNQYMQLKPSALELAESLEQLRLLENGIAMHVTIANSPAVGIESAEDYQRFVARYQAGKKVKS